MNGSARLIKVLLLATALSGAAISVGAAPPPEPATPGVTGVFLAGTRAIADLNTTNAAQFFRDALSGEPRNPYVAERAFIALAANGDIEDAAANAEALLEISPGNELAQLAIGAVALKERRYEDVTAALSNVRPDSFATILAAWALVGQGKPDEAEALLNDVGGDSLRDALFLHRALMADIGGNRARAIKLAQQANAADPLDARSVELLARLLGNSGRFDEAEVVIDNYLLEGFTHPMLYAVGEDIENKRRPGPFAETIEAGASEMFYSTGVAFVRSRSPDIAAVLFQIGLYLDPEADVMALALGQILDQAGQHQLANAVYDAIAEDSAMKPTAVIRMAQNLEALDNRDQAINELTEIVNLNPEDFDAITALGDMQRLAERYVEAAESYTAALKLSGGNRPSDWRNYYVRGIAYERAKQWQLAEADFRRALELRPDQPQVLNYLGYTLVDLGLKLEEALDMIERAVAAAPNEGYIVDSLGWAFYRLGRYEEAVEALERAARLEPNNAEVNDHLGDAYWQTGRRREARFQWTIATYVDEEDGAVTARANEKLANGLADPTAVAAQTVTETVSDTTER